jgi:geranylgeranyl pyrophosphate synthase
MAYQLRDDLHDLINEGTDALKDLRRGRLTLPLIHSYNTCSTDERKQITDTLQILLKKDSDQDFKATKKILEIIRKTGSQEYCEKRMKGFLNQAVASVSKIRKTEYKTYLGEMVKILKSTG